MNETPEMPGPPDEPARPAEAPTGTFASRFVWILTSPKQIYADIAHGAHWWEPWVWSSIFGMVVAWLSIPIQIQITRANPSGMPAEQLDKTLEAMEKFAFIGVVSTPVALLVAAGILTAISYMLVSLLAEESSFKKYFTLVMWANIPVVIGQLIGVIVARMKGIENIRSIHDASSNFGPAILADPEKDKYLYPILTSLDVFYLWFYALLVLGLVAVFRMSMRNAVLVVIPVWLLQVLFAVIGARFSGG